MPVRLFMTNWSVIDGSVVNPIGLYIDQQESSGGNLPQFDFVQNYYPTAAANGRPDKVQCLVMVKGSIGVEAFGTLNNVYMIPPERYAEPMSNRVLNAFRRVSDAFGIPPNLIDDAATNGEAIDRVIRYLEPASNGLPPDFTDANGDDFA